MDAPVAGTCSRCEIGEAAGGEAQVIMDSGIMRDTDVIKALCLGADVVAIGKLMAWCLAAGSVQGLVRGLELLKAEMSVTMANMGVQDVAELSPDMIRRVRAGAGTAWPADL